MGLTTEYIEGQTPLDEDKKGLRIPSITTQKELDEFEQLNIEIATQWTLGKKLKAEHLFSQKKLLKTYISECMEKFGNGQALLEPLKRT